MGNPVADAMLARWWPIRVSSRDPESGGLRSSYRCGRGHDGRSAGRTAFQNTAVYFQVTGAALVEALENGVKPDR